MSHCNEIYNTNWDQINKPFLNYLIGCISFTDKYPQLQGESENKECCAEMHVRKAASEKSKQMEKIRYNTITRGHRICIQWEPK